MREIEFRGKKEGNGGWAYGYLGTLAGGDCLVIENGDDWDGVIEETVGQYTGLKDKNGKKIFEGDILCTTFKDLWNNKEEKVYYFVKFNQGMFAIFYYDFLEEVEEDRLCEALIKNDCLKVVGNIYDNPELLDKGE